MALDRRFAPKSADNKRDHEKNQKDVEKGARDVSGRACDATKTKATRDQSHYEKKKNPA
jgi:hypothetical protein